MKRTGAWLFCNALEKLGVRHTFGIPGVHTTEIYDELNKSNQIKPILVTHEAGAAFMADAVSRTTDRIGVLVVVPAAGLTHAMSGIGEAFLDGIPMLVVSGGVRTDTGYKYQLHDMDMQALMAPITKKTYRVLQQDDVMSTIFEAYEMAMTGEPGPVYVEIPANVQFKKGSISGIPDAPVLQNCKKPLDMEAIIAAKDLLASARKPGIFLGWGARSGRDHAVRIAESLNAPVSTSLQGLAAFPHDHPLHAGMGFGSASVPAAEEAFKDCDIILAVGVRFGEIATGSFSSPVPPKVIHIDINPEALGANYEATVAIEADAKIALPALADALEARAENAIAPSPASQIADLKKAYPEEWMAHNSKGRVNPAIFFKALDARLNSEAIIVVDDGNHTFLTAELLPLSGQRRFISPTDFNCMGYCVPAAIAAKLENQNKQVVGIVGDGAFMMTGLEMLTAASQGIGVIYFVFSDGELSQIAQAQELPYNRKSCTQLPPLKYDAFAEAVGAGFVRIDANGNVETGIKTAQETAATGKPVLVEVVIDYSKKTRFTLGAMKVTLDRFDLGTKARFISRALTRKFTG